MARWQRLIKASPLRLGTVLILATGTLPGLFLACGQASPVPATGGTGGAGQAVSPVDTGRPPPTGGSLANGGAIEAGVGADAPLIPRTGGDPAGGGHPGSGGIVAAGGNGQSGGILATGGVTARTGGIAGRTGGTVDGDGGTAPAGSGGSPGTDGGLVTNRGGSTPNGFPARFVGNIDSMNRLPTDFASYWDQITPENAGKWSAIEASRGTFNWAALDSVYKYAEDNQLIFKEHCFVWGAGLPSWQSSLDATSAPLALKTWMKTFCDRYPKTRIIDVVNEPPPHTTPPYVAHIGGGNRTTWDWIANAFKWAREACPNAVLLLNDYNNLEYDSYVQNTIDIVKAIQKLDAPIDAIGCQSHGLETMAASTVKANIDKIVDETGLPVYITEFDINLADNEAQRQKYAEYIPMFWDHPDVKGITLWGYLVGRTWRPNTGIMTTDGARRPAMSWLMEFLGR